ncbi:protein C10 [Chironomus tepperi]|uniref:protein C10 n=1 Tax=Chironomus tepperi TaxID=113505 RepID=UPI00391FB325
MAHNMNLETARKILIDILKAIALPENSKKLSEAKSLSGKETIKFFQQVFPIVMEIQMNVVSNYGFSGREGLIQFEQLIRELETSDPEIARLREQIRTTYLPPMNSTSPDVLI